MDIYHLVYRSKATPPATEQILKDIVKVSRERNEADLITGFLIYRDGYYMQLLEGPQTKVKECLQRIRKDERNASVSVLGEVISQNRMMPDWNMVLVHPASVQVSSESYIDLFDLGSSEGVYQDKQALETMLRLFSKNAEVIT